MNFSANTKAILLLLLCAFFWGSCFPIGKHALNQVHALTLVFWRFSIAAICLAIYLKIINSAKPSLTFNQWAWVIIVSAVGIGGLNLGLFTGLEHTSAANGSLIMALSPLATSLISSVAKRTMPTAAQCFSLIVSLSGVLLVITNGDLAVLLNMQINAGDKMIFLGMLAWSSYTYFSQGINQYMPVLPYTFVSMLSGATIIGLMCLVTANVHPLSELSNSSMVGIIDVIYIGLFGTVAGYLLWLNGIRQLGSANASLFFNFVPVFAMLTAFLMGQPITELQLIGIIVVIIGLLLPRLVTLKRIPEPCK